MPEFDGPKGLICNTEPIADPEAFAREAGAASWLYLCGEEFASMEGGMVAYRAGRRMRSWGSSSASLRRRPHAGCSPFTSASASQLARCLAPSPCS
jgi:hypothetical protein